MMSFKRSAKNLWWKQYQSSLYLTREEKEFLSNFEEDEFISLLPLVVLYNTKKLTLKEAVNIVINLATPVKV